MPHFAPLSPRRPRDAATRRPRRAVRPAVASPHRTSVDGSGTGTATDRVGITGVAAYWPRYWSNWIEPGPLGVPLGGFGPVRMDVLGLGNGSTACSCAVP